MNKKILVAAISATLFSGVATAVDLDTGLPVDLYAAEIDTSVAGGVTLGLATPPIITTQIGFSFAPGENLFFRFELSPATSGSVTPGAAPHTWGTAITAADLDVSGLAGGGGTIVPGDVSVSWGGAITDNFVVFQVNNSSAVSTAILEDIIFSPSSVNVTDSDPVSISFTTYEDAVDARNDVRTELLYENTGSLIDYADSLALNCLAINDGEQIDVAGGAVDFTGTSGTALDNILGSVEYAFTSHRQIDGAAMADSTIILTPSSDMSFGSSGTWAGIDNLSTTAASANLISSPLVAGRFVDTTVDLDHFAAPIPVTANALGANLIPIQSSSIDVEVVEDPQAGYLGVTETCTLGDMTRNGSHDRLTFALTPGGNFKNFVRITNPSAVAGLVNITVTDDDGTTSNIDLSDVSGQPASLNAGASTDLINIDLIAAATTGLDLTGKLRIDVFGEFGADHGGSVSAAAHMESGINIQSFSMSKDNNSFFMLTPE